MPHRLLAPALLLALPGTALAHTGHGEAAGLASGLLHPLTGVDHVLAMVAVGLLAVRLGGRALWGLPLGFMAMLLLAGGLAMGGPGSPVVELGIGLSVVVLGALIAAGRPLPQALALALVAVFAGFHGYAHGAEMPLGAHGLAYAAGFVAATGGLHLLGIALGAGLARIPALPAARALGATIAVCGVAILAV
jgi:urease accessory protein